MATKEKCPRCKGSKVNIECGIADCTDCGFEWNVKKKKK